MDHSRLANRLAEAMDLARQGSLGQSESILQEIFAQHPDHPDGLQLLGLMRRQQGLGADAIALFKRSLAVQPNQPHVENNLGNALMDAGMAKDAIVAYRRAIGMAPEYCDAWLNLASALHQQKDLAAAAEAADRAIALLPQAITPTTTAVILKAVDRVLKLWPAHFAALMLKGDLLAHGGNRQAATSFYSAALRVGNAARDRSPNREHEMRRAGQFCNESTKLYEEFLRESLSSEGFSCRTANTRFGMALDILFGRRRLYAQEPTMFHYPELPTVEFYDRRNFSWVEGLEASTKDIRQELEGLLETESGFEPYLRSSSEAVQLHSTPLLDNADWSAFYLQKDSAIIERHAKACPKTMAALEAAPLAAIPGRTPSILFSMLRPQTHIPPHTGLLNTRLICHLPLVVPDGCSFRVGSQLRHWREGELLIFNDSIEHEARNDSGRRRVVLLFEIWRPELSGEERSFVQALFSAIDAFGRRVSP